jgi:hypothetical protein
VKQLICFLSGGHVPVRNALSSSRIFCSRCGIELEKIVPVMPEKAEESPTTVKRFVLAKFR